MKSKNRFFKAKNPHNQYLFEYFNHLKIKCMGSGKDKLVFGYQKILSALQKYPVPILTGFFSFNLKRNKPNLFRELDKKLPV